MINSNFITPLNEFESNLVYELESNNTSWNTSIIASFRAPSARELAKKEQNVVFPSEFSSFSYKPNFFKPIAERDHQGSWQSQTSDKISNFSQSSRKNKYFPKSTSVGHSLTYIKRLPSEIKLKLQNSEWFVLKEIKFSQQLDRNRQHSHRVKSVSKFGEINQISAASNKSSYHTYRKQQ